MRTNLTPEQCSDPRLAAVEGNLRACVHCGICTATCPTYLLTGDERDGPRGRIVMMQRMLEADAVPSPETVRHLDRCLSCLGCRTACPSSVDYARLIDTARVHIHTHYRRPWYQRAQRFLIANVMTRPRRMGIAVALAQIFAPLSTRLPGRWGVMARKACAMQKAHIQRGKGTDTTDAKPKPRIGLMPGCVQQSLAPEIDEAAGRVLRRRDMDLVPLAGAGCCGALPYHLGQLEDAKAWGRRAIAAFESMDHVEAVTITATGCAAHLADYAHLFADEPGYRERAKNFAAKVRDFAELAVPRPAEARKGSRLALHIPCSQQHGLRRATSETALIAAGFAIAAIPDGHLCCGSAGSYALLEPEMADALRRNKLDAIAGLRADAVASANIGCLVHLAGPDAPPLVHPAELIDWAEGGPCPRAIRDRKVAVATQRTG